MEALAALFPTSDFTLLAFIVLLPLIGAAVNGIFGKRLGKEAVTLLGLTVIGVSFLLSLATFFLLARAQEGEHAARFVWKGWEWMRMAVPLPGGRSAAADSFPVSLWLSLSVDALSGAMALVVTGVGFLIHLYSTKYMEHDEGYHRFFAYLNLFIFSMLVLILGDSLPVLFVGWEGVGLCSYLLIGFWFQDEKNAAAGKKAFIANRIGDFGLLVAMGLLLYYTRALDFQGIEAGAQNLLTPVQVWPFGTHVPAASLFGGSVEEWLNTPRYVSAATLVGLALFLGCAGKSAQIPLYVWLPDAMAGPTPVSALIHAATMVTAGVYLVCRMSAIFVLSPAAMFTVALIGALTAVFAATIAFAQTDIKKVLAYSTVSQLGYMFLGAGVGAFSAGFFHVLTHAFFKACLFLGAGSVIHAMHARIHDMDAAQDMRNMGGLKKHMPITFWTFAASWAAIIGIPFTSGFFSKDEILIKAYTSFVTLPTPGGRLDDMTMYGWPSWGPNLLYGLGLAAAIMTAFYMSRLFFGVFFGEFRGWKIVKKWKEPEHGHDHHAHDHDPGTPLEGPSPKESPWQMTLPLVILGALALGAGALNAHAFLHSHVWDSWVEPVFAKAQGAVQLVEDWQAKEMVFIALAILAAGAGAGAAYWVYIMRSGEPARELTERAPGLHALVRDKWRIDELYEETILGAVDSLAEFFVWADKWLVDGIIARLSAFVVRASGTVLRYAQTGRVQAYAAVMVLGLGGMGWFFVRPHPTAKVVENHAAGAYSVSLAPGLGYSYRWDENGDGRWDSEDFGDQTQVSFNLDVDKSRTVRVEVKNAFGRVATKEFPITRPKPDLSGGPGRASGTTTIDVRQDPDGKLRGTPRGGGATPQAPIDLKPRQPMQVREPLQPGAP
jgi:NADH-quinone oxidoreductase subunit L